MSSTNPLPEQVGEQAAAPAELFTTDQFTTPLEITKETFQSHEEALFALETLCFSRNFGISKGGQTRKKRNHAHDPTGFI